MDEPSADGMLLPDWLREILDSDGEVRAANHYVPVTYLKHFAMDPAGDPILWLYDRESPSSPKQVHARVLAVQNRLYVVDEAPIPDIIERFFGWIESYWDRLWRKLVCGYEVGGFYMPLSRAENESLKIYLAFQEMRTPFLRDVNQRLNALEETIHVA
jgi:hypothetical protein